MNTVTPPICHARHVVFEESQSVIAGWVGRPSSLCYVAPLSLTRHKFYYFIGGVFRPKKMKNCFIAHRKVIPFVD